MPYKSDKQLTFELFVIHAFRVLVKEGMETPDNDLWTYLHEAQSALNIPHNKAEKINRCAFRVLRAVIKPFEESEASVAKFGLAFYYTLRHFIDKGRFEIVDNSPLDKFCEQLLSDDGTLTEIANVDKVDKSAQKAARKMIEVIRREL